MSAVLLILGGLIAFGIVAFLFSAGLEILLHVFAVVVMIGAGLVLLYLAVLLFAWAWPVLVPLGLLGLLVALRR